MLKIGCHLSVSKGFYHMAQEAYSIGANVFQFFTRNPRGSKAKAWLERDIALYREFADAHGFGTILAHAPYVLNPCAAGEDARRFACEVMADDLRRLESIPDCMYNFHPGSHVGQGSKMGIQYIADALNWLETHKYNTVVLLETMAGKGTEIGGNFEELGAIIDKVEDSANIGVCLDTCHVFDNGYDISENLDGVLKQFDDIIGLERLRAIHLNDSKNPCGSHKDRHEKLGEGEIGISTFKRIVTHKDLRSLPFYLETPNELSGYAQEIAMIRDAVRMA